MNFLSNGNGNEWIWVLIIFFLIVCCNDNGCGNICGGNNNNCGCDNNCCDTRC